MSERFALTFVVPGVAQTKGSSKAFVPLKWAKDAAAKWSGKDDRAPKAIVQNDNPKTKAWQERIAERAVAEMARTDVQAFADGPVLIDAWFYLPRPKKFLIAKWANVDVPHTTKPDADKLLRAAKDALSRVVWSDDSQVIDAYAHKRYVEAGKVPRAVITVRAVKADLPKPIVHQDTPSLFGEVLYGE